jgi:hypothetical protein
MRSVIGRSNMVKSMCRRHERFDPIRVKRKPIKEESAHCRLGGIMEGNAKIVVSLRMKTQALMKEIRRTGGLRRRGFRRTHPCPALRCPPSQALIKGQGLGLLAQERTC